MTYAQHLVLSASVLCEVIFSSECAYMANDLKHS